MTMLSVQRAPSASSTATADRLLDPLSQVSLSTSASNCSDMFLEEKKSADEGNFTPDRVKRRVDNSAWRNMISNEPGSKFLPEKGRYTLYVSRACPSSHTALLVHTLKGLEDVVSVVHVRPHPEDHLQRRWMISDEIPDDSLASLKSDEGDFNSVSDIYQKEQRNNSCNTIPLLYDKHHECIVNNNGNDIIAMFNSSLNELCRNPTVDLLSENDQTTKAKMAELQTWLYPLLQLTPNHFQYDVSPRAVEYAFDRATHILQTQRYLTSHTHITEADLRLFVALIRYEEVYAKYLLQQRPTLRFNPALMDYCRDIYQQYPGVAETISMEEIREHYLGIRANRGNSSSGSIVELMQMPHKRHLL